MNYNRTGPVARNARSGTREKGNRGEERAAEYLLTQGYEVVCRKYQSRRGEIDCIARDPDGTLVFVEVKSSGGKTCGSPFSWVTPAKQRKLSLVARQYLAEHRLTMVPCRFDVIGITGERIEHLRNVIIGR